MRASVCLVLHAHLPFVRHPEHPRFLEEEWFFEAVVETYLPLLDRLVRLREEGVPYRLSLTLSPTLCEMMADPLLQERCIRHLARLCEISGEECRRREAGTLFRRTAEMYRESFGRIRELLEGTYRGNLLPGFADLQDSGHIEILTCSATHAILPHVLVPQARRAQLQVAARNYAKHFGRRPRGIWLPECAYEPGLEEMLAEEGFGFFFVDTHGLQNATEIPRYGVYAPCRTPSGVAVLGRDPECSRQVWSAKEGYPGDPVYREFYRDLGFDAEEGYIRPYLQEDGVRRNVGLKFHRVTGEVPLQEKEPYDPVAAMQQARRHAAHFVGERRDQIEWLRERMDRPPVIVAPYDAELFGHWWFEGPEFLEGVIRQAAREEGLRLATASDVIGGTLQTLVPSASSWGDRGYFDVWLNSGNEEEVRHRHHAEQAMVQLARDFAGASGVIRRALDQAARELLLAEASDWPFLITSGTAESYARKRFRTHIARFLLLEEQIRAGAVDEELLVGIESKDTIFPEMDYRVYEEREMDSLLFPGAGSESAI